MILFGLTCVETRLKQERRGEPLVPETSTIQEQGLASVQDPAEEQLDAAVVAASGQRRLTKPLR